MRIPLRFVILIVVLAEIAVLIGVGQAIGVAATLGLTLLASFAGCVLLRRQGVATLMRMRADIDAGRLPARPLAEGAAGAMAALLLILPGFISDAVALVLLIPAARRVAWRLVAARMPAVRVTRSASAPVRAPVVDLESHEYGVEPRRDSPWQGEPSA